MIDGLVDAVTNVQFMLALFTAIAVFATIITLAMPLLSDDQLNKRMKYVASEREQLRARERARLDPKQAGKVSLRQEPKKLVKDIVNRLGLRDRLLNQDQIDRLRQAGYRGEAPVVTLAFARFIMPFILFLIAVIYLFGSGDFEQPALLKLGIAGAIGGVGVFVPNLFLSNIIQKRQTSIRRAWPDALDLMLICVESGMSIEAAFKKVSDEIGIQSPELAEEMVLTTAELSYLQERRQAYENLGRRTGLDGVKAVMTSLIQAERYGTPLAHSLRVLAQENRDMRMQEAEKKAAGLPPKLTVPMILFFLPCLFVVIIGPTIIRLMNLD
ncbi:MAG: type II secretion system F family protein [Hyphomicrobiales bacterium]